MTEITWINSSAEDLTAIIGFTATARLMVIHGEKLVAIPVDAPPGHPLEKLLGKGAFWRLRAEFGGKTLRVPCNTESDRISLVRAIAVMVSRGQRINDIADATDLSPRKIKHYIASAWVCGLLDDKRRKKV